MWRTTWCRRRSGFLWFFTNNGWQRFDGNKFIAFKRNVANPSSLPTGEVTQVYLDKQITESSLRGYNLWSNNPKDIVQYNDILLVVAAGALNVLKLNNGQIQHISHYDGLPSNTVQSSASDASGNLWLGPLSSLCRADLTKLSFATYHESDGLLNDGFNMAGAHRLNDGRLLFTSAESLLIFDPSFMRRKDRDSKPVVTDFKLMNRSLPVDSLLKKLK